MIPLCCKIIQAISMFNALPNMHFSTHLHAGVDFNTSVFDLSFGKSEELIRMSFSTNSDSRSELTEGFLCYLEVIEDQLHPRDVGRIDFFNQLVLVQILDNDGKNVWTLVPVIVKTYIARKVVNLAYGQGGLKLEINIPLQHILAKSKGGLIIEGGVSSSEYGT